VPTFDTPEPITVTLELGVADIRIVAGDRTDTVVEVRPANPEKESDVTAAEATRVEYAAGRLLIKAPKGWRQYSFRGGGESIVVQIDLPAGSEVRGQAAVATLHGTGRLGECQFKSSAGDIHLAQSGPLHVKTAAGDVTVEHIAGDAVIATASGAVKMDRVDGAAVVKNANGDTWIGEVTGDVRVSSANGRIVVERAQASVVAKTARGDVRIGEVRRGAVLAETAFGTVDIGIHDGVAAWLDVNTRFGQVQNDLDAAGRPADGEETVEVRARTAFGDIAIRRAVSPRTAG
jgi:putative adhesin